MRKLAFPFSAVVLLIAALHLFLVLASCRREGVPEQPAAGRPQVHEIRKEVCKGPFCVRIATDKDSINVAESVTLTLEAEAGTGYEAEFPALGEKLGELNVREYREGEPRLAPDGSGRIVTKKTASLEPFLPGDNVLSPLLVRFHKKAQEGTAAGQGDSTERGSPDAGSRVQGTATEETSKDAALREEVLREGISTEEITIKVYSLLQNGGKEPALNPIKGPMSLPPEPLSPWHILLGLGAAALVAGGVFLFLRRRRSAVKHPAAPALPAHDLAYRQLQEIFDERLLERGEFKLFFSRISDVLRGYIENRFGLHAPKRTTEEFLADISRKAPFSAGHKELLVDFLSHCDLVKFAEHRPSEAEIGKTIDSCKAFIDATKIRPVDEP